MKPETSFDPQKHEYRIRGAQVPSVTAVLGELLPAWKAGEWYLQRGRAVHAAAALLAQGKTFEFDPRIFGQVQACKRFFLEVKPQVEAVEMPVFSRIYRFAGTLDLVAKISGKRMVCDYKAALTPATPIQCAGYSLCLPAPRPDFGAGIELREDGHYRISQIYDLRKYRNEFLALLTVYNLKKRFKLLEETK